MNMRLFGLAVALLSFGAVGSAAEAQVGKPFDLQAFIDKGLKAGRRRITVPPGRYRATPHDRVHLRLAGLKDVTIIADGVEMICTETTAALQVVDCARVKLQGLTIDYDPLPYTQGRITAISPDRSEHTIALFDGFPDAASVRNFKYEIYRPDMRLLRCDAEMRLTYYPSAVEVIDPGHIRVTKGSGAPTDPEKVGDIVVIASEHAPGGSIPHAVTVERCTAVELTRVTVWASNCFGVLELEGDGNTYRECRIDRRPPAQDLVKRADPRIRSLNADAFHSIGSTKGPSIIGCSARFMGDDAVNIHGSYSMVTACSGAKLRVLLNGAAPRVGEPVELVTYEGVRLPDATVTACAPAAGISAEERAFLMRQAMNDDIRSRRLTDAVVVTLDRAVEMPMGSVMACAKRIGNGFLVSGCDFGFNRSRGILIKASDGQVIGNRITGGWMAAILVSPEYWWLEAGSSCGVRIAGNTITDCGGAAIVVEAQGGAGRTAPAGAHRDVVIKGNSIADSPMPAIRVTSTQRLIVQGNRVTKPVGPKGAEPVKLEQCSDVTSAGNRVR